MKNRKLLLNALTIDMAALVTQWSRVSEPDVSIVVITYNHGSYLGECLESIEAACGNLNYEVVLADDASDSESQKVIDEWVPRFGERLTLIQGSRDNNIRLNGRPTGIFNYWSAVLAARSEFVAIIEGDDHFIGANAVASRLDLLRNSEYSVVWGRAISSLNERSRFEAEEVNAQSMMFWSGKVNTCGTMYRSSCLDARNIVPFLKCMNQDVVMFHALLSNGNRGFLMSEVTSFYRIHESSMWSSAELKTKRVEMIKTNFMLSGHYHWDENLPMRDYDRMWLEWILGMEESSWRTDVVRIRDGFASLWKRLANRVFG